MANHRDNLVHGKLALHAYGTIERGQIVDDDDGWVVEEIIANETYRGVVYKNESSKQLVLAHLGTPLFSRWLDDCLGVVRATPDFHEALASALRQVIRLLTSMDDGFVLSFASQFNQHYQRTCRLGLSTKSRHK